jgi:hypothetical protein
MFGSEYWLGSRVECENINREFYRPANVSINSGSPRTVFRIATLMVNLTTAVTPRVSIILIQMCTKNRKNIKNALLAETWPTYTFN